jgi:predicted membrane chloride channel (bestrophin family)
VKRVLTPVGRDHDDPHIVGMRQFWATNAEEYKSRSSHVQPKEEECVSKYWSVASMLQGAWSRSVPLKMTFGYLSFASVLTIPFELLSVPGVIDLHPLVAYFMSHSEALTKPVGFLSTALFLMLPFRLNRATARWWRARTLWTELHADVRSMVQAAQLYITDPHHTIEVALLAAAYPRAVELQLRGSSDDDIRRAFSPLLGSADHIEALVASFNRNFFLAERTTLLLNDAFNSGHVRGIRALVAIQAVAQQLNRTVEALAALQSTPEPWSYQKHSRFTTLLWLTVLPVALVCPSCSVAACPRACTRACLRNVRVCLCDHACM